MNWLRTSVTAAVAACIVAGSLGQASAVCTGNPDGLGGVSVNDVAITLTCANNPAAAVCGTSCGGMGIANCADVNLDGVVNIQDAIILSNETAPGCPLNIVPMCASPGPSLPCGSTISTDITTNMVLLTCEYFVDGTIFVHPGVVLTIRPGATIKGRKASTDGSPSALIFLQGDCATIAGLPNPTRPSAGDPFTARINAVGTPAQPIVATSDQLPGARNSGDWGGLAFNGCSHVNLAGGTGDAEGLVGVTFGGGLTPTLTDTNGKMTYVRAEFAGRELAPNNELNVITQNALGSCTDWSFLQAHMGADDGFEWFGGTANAHHLVSTANRDDNIDWQLGTTGKVQFAVVEQTAANLDTAGSNGFEGDNSEADPETNVMPVSEPHLCNITMIGEQTTPGGTNRGMLLRRGTAGRIAKVVTTCWHDFGLQLDGGLTAQRACSAPPAPFTLTPETPPQLLVEASIFGDNDASGTLTPADCGGGGNTLGKCTSADFCNLITSAAAFPNGLGGAPRTNVVNAALSIPCTFGQINPVPAIPAEVANSFDCNTGFGGDPFFKTTNYAGGVDPAGPNWLVTPGNWISFDTN